MRSNKWNGFIGITTFGESHGPAIGVVLEDIKPGIEFPLEQIQQELDKRKPGIGEFSSPRQEQDKIQVISGVFDGLTTGMPICLLVYNRDAKKSDYEHLKNVFRPGHADLTFFRKFKIYDYRGGGRASGRETISRVAAGAVAAKLIEPAEIKLYPIQIGRLKALKIDHEFRNDLHWPDSNNFNELMNYLTQLRQKGDSVGGIIECSIDNLPAGLGDPVFEKLDANLAKAIISIGSVKGIEFGDGFSLAAQTGSQVNDNITSQGFLTNHSGGILGGISTGQNLKFRFVVKPVPSIKIKQKTVNSNNENVELTLNGRYDTCIIPRLIPVAKAMITLVLADAYSFQKLVSDESRNLNDLRESIDKLDEDLLILLKRRFKTAEIIGQFKKDHKLPVLDEARENELLRSLKQKAQTLSMDSTFIEDLWKQIIAETRKKE